ncbi:hypothetical protein ACQKQD_12910 [Methylobacterium sp. NPDC080182]|uniref:hypothetical protein n=1 Tax=Methylobacterium sp. NPDC080182 TaxID=3390590 RepID=UPI003D08DBF0
MNDKATAADGPLPRQLDFFEKGWGVDVFLTFTIDEKSSFNPSISFTPPILDGVARYPGGIIGKASQSQAQSLGAQVSSQANRVDKLHIFYTIADLAYGGRFPSRKELEQTDCITKNASGTLFLSSDLKFHEWFRAIVKLQVFKQGNLDQKNSFATQGVIAHNIKFQIVSTGNYTPSWKLVEFSANTSNSPFLSATRDRTQEIDITMGPLAESGGLKQKALNTILASELRSSLNSVFRLNQ